MYPKTRKRFLIDLVPVFDDCMSKISAEICNVYHHQCSLVEQRNKVGLFWNYFNCAICFHFNKTLLFVVNLSIEIMDLKSPNVYFKTYLVGSYIPLKPSHMLTRIRYTVYTVSGNQYQMEFRFKGRNRTDTVG